MVNKAIIYFVVFLIIISIVGGAIYFIYNKKENKIKDVKIDIYDYSLMTMDKNTKEIITTNYSVYYNDTLFTQGITNSYSYEKIKLPLYDRKFIYVYSNNYYAQQTIFDGELKSSIIELSRIGNIEVEVLNKLNNEDSDIVLKLTSNSLVRRVRVCVNWGANILDVNLVNMTIDISNNIIPNRLNNKVVKCYNTQLSIDNSDEKTKELVLYFTFTKISNLIYVDYINFIFIDSDIIHINEEPYFSLIYEDASYNDVGLKDVKYDLKYEE